MSGMLAVNCEKAFQAGLTFRPLAETIRDTLAWKKSCPVDEEQKAGMKSGREAELLQLWHRTTP